jgi:hypothetical protein
MQLTNESKFKSVQNFIRRIGTHRASIIFSSQSHTKKDTAYHRSRTADVVHDP